MALVVAQRRATNATFNGGLNTNITANPVIGVAVRVAPLTNPAKEMIIPAVAPPKKFVTSMGIGFAEMISTCDNGSIATEIVVFRSPNFMRLQRTIFIKEDTKTTNAPIAIGTLVSSSIAVKDIELK